MITRGSLQIYQGDDYTGIVTVLNADGTAADLSTYTPRAQIRRKVADLDPVIVAELTLTVDENRITLSLDHDITRTLSGAYVWDLQLTDAAGEITTIMAGSVPVTLEVTRPVLPLAELTV
jgi:hypothetical protein